MHFSMIMFRMNLKHEQLYVNNLPKFITQLNLEKQARFEPKSFGS